MPSFNDYVSADTPRVSLQVGNLKLNPDSEMSGFRSDAGEDALRQVMREADRSIFKYRAAVMDLKRMRDEAITAGRVEMSAEFGSFQSGSSGRVVLGVPGELVKFEIEKQLESRRTEYRKSLIALRDAVVAELEAL